MIWLAREKSLDGKKREEMYLKAPSKGAAALRRDPAPTPGLGTLLTCTCHLSFQGHSEKKPSVTQK